MKKLLSLAFVALLGSFFLIPSAALAAPRVIYSQLDGDQTLVAYLCYDGVACFDNGRIVELEAVSEGRAQSVTLDFANFSIVGSTYFNIFVGDDCVFEGASGDLPSSGLATFQVSGDDCMFDEGEPFDFSIEMGTGAEYQLDLAASQVDPSWFALYISIDGDSGPGTFPLTPAELNDKTGAYVGGVYDYVVSTLSDAGAFRFGVVLCLIALVVAFAWRWLRKVFA